MTEPQRDITRSFLAVPVALAVARKLLSAWVDEEIGEFEPPGQQALSQEE